jgi:hypothetical protein
LLEIANRNRSPLPELARVLVRLDDVAGFIVHANHGTVRVLKPVVLKEVLTGNGNLGSIGHMKTRTTGLTLALCFFGAALCFAADPHMGTWKLNEAKSKITPGTTKFTTVTFKNMLVNMKVTSDGTGADGKSIHIEWSGKFDGKDYPITGDPSADTRAYRKLNDRTLEVTVKKNRKVTATAHTVVSADGKSRTATVTGTTPKGKKFKNVVVYDKQ